MYLIFSCLHFINRISNVRICYAFHATHDTNDYTTPNLSVAITRDPRISIMFRGDFHTEVNNTEKRGSLARSMPKHFETSALLPRIPD